jgi:hypothetical protein
MEGPNNDSLSIHAKKLADLLESPSLMIERHQTS